MTREKLLSVVMAVLTVAPGLSIAVAPAWAGSKERVLYALKNYKTGAGPCGGVTFDAAGDLYGTTRGGGAAGEDGAVFQLIAGANGKWTEKVLHRLKGQYPQAGVIFDAAGNLYSTTTYGGAYGGGSVFRLAPRANGTWVYTVIHSFNGKDGYVPSSNLIFDATGNLYGTTGAGGADDQGTVFQLTPGANGKWTEKVLHSFRNDGRDGEGPVGIVLDAAGDLYGSTFTGGRNSCENYKCGIVFQLSRGANGRWTEKVLHDFTGNDGAQPAAGLIFDNAGNLYGTTEAGGDLSQCPNSGCGTVFRLTPGAEGVRTEKVLYSFQSNGKDGEQPNASLIFDKGGSLYGTTFMGGTFGGGTVFSLTPDANGDWTERIVHSFKYDDGRVPQGGLTVDTSGNLYGTAGGGDRGGGVVFEITP